MVTGDVSTEVTAAGSAEAELIASITDAVNVSVRTSEYDFDVDRDESLGQYSALINGYEIGIINYVRDDMRTVLMSVTVASSYRGQGIATEFIARVLDDIRNQGRTVTVECPVIAAFMQRFLSYADMIDSTNPGSAILAVHTSSNPKIRPRGTSRLKVLLRAVAEEPADRITSKVLPPEREGIYVDRVSGEPLFASIHRFESDCSFLTFNAAIEPENLVLRFESIFAVHRTEVRSREGGNHLGYVFTDGTPEDGCLRYCVDLDAVRYVPAEQLEADGYSDFRSLFQTEDTVL